LVKINVFILLNPKKIEQSENLIESGISLKRDPGLFSSWKKSHIIITKQENVLVFDENVTFKKHLHSFDAKKLRLKNLKSSKFPYRFDMYESKKGFMFNTKVNETFDAESAEKYEEVVKLLGDNALLATEESQILSKRGSKLEGSSPPKRLSKISSDKETAIPEENKKGE